MSLDGILIPQESSEQVVDGNEPIVSEEVKPEEPKTEPEKPKEDPFSKKFVAINKKEKALRDKEKQLNARFAELERKMAEMNPVKPEVKLEPLDRRLKKDPLNALKEMGLTFDKLAELQLADGKLSHEDQLQLMREELEMARQADVAALRQEIAEKEQQRMQEQEVYAVNQFKGEIKNFIDTSADFNFISDLGGADLVYDKIEEHYKETSEVLTIKQAADQIKSDLMRQVTVLMEKLKLGAPKPQTPPTSQKTEVRQANTLTNKVAAPQSGQVIKEGMSRDEAKAAAAAMLKWNE